MPDTLPEQMPEPLRCFTIDGNDDPTGMAPSQYRVRLADYETIRRRVRDLRKNQPATGVDVVVNFGRPGRRIAVARAVMTPEDLEALREQAAVMDR